ANSRYPTSII
nr:Chain C, Y-iCAL36 peptide [synthetic construct]4JOK_D Chain D, Y-iCAL36 peptide [synthetic construct]